MHQLLPEIVSSNHSNPLLVPSSFHRLKANYIRLFVEFGFLINIIRPIDQYLSFKLASNKKINKVKAAEIRVECPPNLIVELSMQ